MIAGNAFEWEDEGIPMDILDVSDLRVYLSDIHDVNCRRWDICYRELITRRVTADLICTSTYEQGFPTEMLLTRTFTGIPAKAQSVQVIGEGYKELQPLLNAAQSHAHADAGVPYDNNPRFIWTMDWTAALSGRSIANSHMGIR